MKKRLSPTSIHINHSLAFAVASSLSAFAVAEPTRELPVAQAHAQTEEGYKVEASTRVQRTQPLLDTAQTITVIPQAVMKDRGVESLRDALRSVSGISLAAGEGGTPTGDAMTIRGFDARTDIFVDGLRDIAGYYRDTYNVESVEVSKGPSSAISGRGSTGGSINLQSKMAQLEDASDATARIGSEGDYRVAVDSNTAVGETSALRVNALYQDGDVSGRDEVNNSSAGLAAAFASGLGTDKRFHLNAEYFAQDNLPDYGIPWVSGDTVVPELEPYVNAAPPVPFSHFYGNILRDYEEITATSATAKYEQDLSANTVLRVLGRVGKVARESIVTAPRFIDTSTTTDIRLSDEKTRDQENALQTLQAALLGRFDTGSVNHNVVAGLEFVKEVEKRWQFDDEGTDNLDTTPELNDLYNPNPAVPYSGQYRRIGNPTEAIGTTWSAFVFDTISFNPQWELGLGLRADNFETEYFNDYEDRGAVIETSDAMVSWNASLVYKPHVNGSLYLGAGNSYNPSAEDLTASTTTAEFDPEEATSVELGTKWDLLDNRLNLTAAVFQTQKTDTRISQGRGQPTVNGDQEVTGVELSAAGQITDAWLLMASLTHQKAEITNLAEAGTGLDGVPLARAPENSASLWTRYDFSPEWAAGVGLQYVGESYNGARTTARRAPAYTLVEMMVSYEINANVSLQLNGTNLADEEYISQVGGGHFVPGEGQYFRLTGRYTF